MTWVDAKFEKEKSTVYVVERVEGQRIYKEYPANLSFYHDDPKGKFRTIFDTPVNKVVARSWKEFQKEKRMHTSGKIWESDIKPVNKCIEDHYLNSTSPTLHTAFFDIETGWHDEKGFSPPEDPFNPITAISIYLDWIQQMITLVVPPKSLSLESATEICAKFDNCILFDNDGDLLTAFLDVIEDADILSGWNSEGFDIPYVVNRITRTLSKNDTRRLCLWDDLPSKRDFERYGTTSTTYDLSGRVHLDYMQLYRKYTYHEMHSYSLDAIGEYELDERKVIYSGTLDQLYNQDFEKFIAYGRQDTLLVAKLDTRLKFIDLANELAHSNGVMLMATMGTVAVTDQAIINEAHYRNMIVPDKNFTKDNQSDDDVDAEVMFNADQAAGAYVATPKVGMHRDIGAIDINSLYPSTIRALNMGPDTLIGQLRPIMTNAMLHSKMQKVGKKKGMTFAGAWDGQFGSLEYQAVMNRSLVEITIDWENGQGSTTHTAAEVWSLIFESGKPWCISANGTILTYEKKGIIPSLLERWYAERKELQAKKKSWGNLLSGIKVPDRLL